VHAAGALLNIVLVKKIRATLVKVGGQHHTHAQPCFVM
jgi:hypothetical protein